MRQSERQDIGEGRAKCSEMVEAQRPEQVANSKKKVEK